MPTEGPELKPKTTRRTAAQREVLRAAAKGELADLSRFRTEKTGELVALPAVFLRELLCLGLPKPGRNGERSRLPFGLWIKAARIEGTLDLREAHGPGGNGCPPLILEDCHLIGDPGPNPEDKDEICPCLDARHAHLLRLSLKRCRASFIDLSDAEIGGNLDLDELQALPGSDLCWVRARGVRVDGSVSAAEAKLSLGDLPEPEEWKGPRFALHLGEAEIGGALILRPGFEAEGGINLTSARIRGEWWCDGASLSVRSGPALKAQGTEVDGAAVLRCLNRNGETDRFRVRGQLSFYGARFKGTLDLSGAKIEKGPAEEGDVDFLGFRLTTIDGHLLLGPWKGVEDRACQDGSDELQQTEAPLFPVEVAGRVAFLHSEVAGKLLLDATCAAVWSDSSVFKSDVTLRNVCFPVSLIGTQVKGKLHLAGSGGNVLTRDLVVDGSLELENVSFPVTLIGTQVKGKLHLAGSGGNVLTRDLVVDGSLELEGRFGRRVGLQGARVGGDIVLGTRPKALELQGSPAEDLSSEPDLSLADARVGGTLLVNKVGPLSSLPEGAQSTWFKDEKPKVRRLAAPFYPGWWIGEAMGKTPGGDRFLVSFLMTAQGEKVILLPGDSPPIHAFNAQAGHLVLDTDERRKAYLRFFCGHIWGEEGPFTVIESPEQLPVGATETSGKELKVEPLTRVDSSEQEAAEGPWKYSVMILYSNALFRSVLLLKKSGMVDMLEDEPVETFDNLPLVKYEKPLRNFGRGKLGVRPAEWPAPPCASMEAASWEELKPGEASAAWKGLVRPFEDGQQQALAALRKRWVWISLERGRAKALWDDKTASWDERVIVDMNGFEYDFVDSSQAGSSPHRDFGQAAAFKVRETGEPNKEQRPKSRVWKALEPGLGWFRRRLGLGAQEPASEWRARLDWLVRQAAAIELVGPGHGFSPQPFEVLGDRLRRHGEAIGAREVTLQMLRTRTVEKRWSKWIWKAFDTCFGYALSPGRALTTFFVCWIAGTFVVDLANYGQLRIPFVPWKGLQVISQASLAERPVFVFDVSPSGLVDEAGAKGSLQPPLLVPQLQAPASITGDVPCEGRIDSAAYALGVFLPIIDLGQEARCTISARPGAVWWRTSKAAYQLIGWVVTTLTIFTLGKRVFSHLEKAGDSISNT